MAVINIVKFRLQPGTDEKDFLAINDRFTKEVAPTLPGLERRESTKGKDGEFMIVLRYKDMESASRGPKADANNEVAAKFMSMLDKSSLSSAHYEVVD